MNVLRPEAPAQDGRYADFAVLQSAAKPEHPTLRTHEVSVGLYDLQSDGHLRRRTTVPVEVSGERTAVRELRGEPVADLLLVNDLDLTFAKLRFDDRSVQTLLEHLSALDDPLPRSLCWAALWDMTRDAELPTRRYVEVVARHARREDEPALIERVLSQAIAAIDQFAEPSGRDRLREHLHDAAREQVDGLPAGSILRLSWTRCLITTSVTAAHLDRLEALLDERDPIEGLPLDTDLRWLIVARLSTMGRFTPADIGRELERDPTDFGRRHAAASLAARPDPAAKSEAWQIMCRPEAPVPDLWRPVVHVPVSLATLAAIMRGFAFGAFLEGGFHRSGQDELLRPYVTRYVDEVPRMWSEHSVEDAEEFTESMYPRYLTDDSLVRALDEALGRDVLPGPARRILQEGRDGTLRARRARDADAAAGAAG
jgi:aminopeptidase N